METATRRRLICALAAAATLSASLAHADPLKLNEKGYFETRGLSVLLFSNNYNGMFGDSKVNGLEFIQHDNRLAANGDVRFYSTPGQWTSIPADAQPGDRKVDREKGTLEMTERYPQYDDFEYTLHVEPKGDGFVVRVNAAKPLPEKYVGQAGFNLEFLPSAFFHKTYLVDGKPGNFQLHPTGPMGMTKGELMPQPIASGKTLVLAPEDPERRVTITSPDAELSLLDGRNVAQNGWFVVRSLLPGGKTGTILEWTVEPNVIPNWTRKPMIGYSQVGYLPEQPKTAVIELDKNDAIAGDAKLLKVSEKGEVSEALSAAPKMWGAYFRRNYATFDFSSVRDPGVYMLEYNGQRTGAFRIDPKVYEGVWHPTMDVFLPEQMDHMLVQEAYRTWHGVAHMDDALQAPTNHVHTDNWYQGPTTDTKYKPLEHIPGMAVGGWFDAGDFDIQTPSNIGVISDLVEAWDRFGNQRDETKVDQEHFRTDLHTPDGVPDVVQQIKHGALQLVAQVKACGHIIPGITDQSLDTYTHLGDGSTQTDNKFYDPTKGPLESDLTTSGRKDDRWAFTNHSRRLNYSGAAALAGAARAIAPYDKAFADECLATAEQIWKDEHDNGEAKVQNRGVGAEGGGTGELGVAVQLLITTKKPEYAQRVAELVDERGNVLQQAEDVLQAMPYMDAAFKEKFDARVKAYAESLKNGAATEPAVDRRGRPVSAPAATPFGVNVGLGNWAGNGGTIRQAYNRYVLHKAYPDLFDLEPVYRGAAYLFGTHPVHNLSFVSGVGVQSKEVAYGNNRADFAFIPGGVVPGALLVQPDYFESHEDWPFFWAENEYTIGAASGYVLLGSALEELGREAQGATSRPANQ